MDELYIEATDKTPLVHLRKGYVLIEGRSIPEDPKKFFRPVQQWIKDYLKLIPSETILTLNLEYCDTGSTKIIFEILKEFSVAQAENDTINVEYIWKYEKGDGEMVELAEFLESKAKITFKYVEY